MIESIKSSLQKMRWPPNKAWTSTLLRKGYRHFVAINYGGKGKDRWVNLVAVLDGTSCLRVSWAEMKDSSMWISGWEQLSRDQANPFEGNLDSLGTDELKEKQVCLHPSIDSGLTIPSDSEINRSWT